MAPSAPVPDFASRPSPGDLFQGVALLGRSFGLILRTPRLLALSVLCAAVTLATLAGLLVLLWSGTPELLGHFWVRPQPWYGQAAWYLVLALAFLVLLVVGVNILLPLVLAPLQDPISELTEELCGDFTSPPFRLGAFLKSVAVSVMHTLARVALLLGGLAVLLPLHLVPGAGSLAWTGLASLWTMTWLAGEHLATPMTRHFHPFSEVVAALRRRWLLCLGFGAGVYLLLWVPVLNTFFLPVAIVGGTLLYRGLRATGDVPPPPASVTGK